MLLAAIEPTSIWTGILSFIGVSAFVCWFVWKLITVSDDPPRVIKRLIYTFILLVIMAIFFRKLFGIGTGSTVGAYGSAMVIAGAAAAFGLILGMLWATEIGELVARPFENLLTGRGQELEPQPFYAIAEAKRKRGDYTRAMEETRKQLELFPTDLKGHILLAEIQAENLKDLEAAKRTVELYVAETELSDTQFAYCMSRLADWHLSLGMDPAAAKECLERITSRCPDTEQAMNALQRIAHLATVDQLAEAKNPRKINLVRNDEYIGLRADSGAALVPIGTTPLQQAQQWVDHLTLHPYDNEAREKLALLYSQELARPDLAIVELEQLVEQPHQTMSHAVRWLNLIADIHLKERRDLPSANDAIQRIIDTFPDSAAAHQAAARLVYMPGELKKHQETHSVKMGSYDQDVGLRMGKARPWNTDKSQEDSCGPS